MSGSADATPPCSREMVALAVAQRPAILRVLALIALAVSAALLADSGLPHSRLCGFESDCDLVIHSPLTERLGVPLPPVGVIVFAGLFGLSLCGNARLRGLFRPAALLAGATGLALLAGQVFVIRHLCPYCLVVDIVAMLLAGFAVYRRDDPFPPVAARQRGAWLAAAAAGLVGGVLLAALDGRANHTATAPVPPQVKALWVTDRVNVVEIYDFECRHCRRMHPLLKQVLAEQGEHIHHVRITVPLPAHAQARDAARAYLCADKQNKGAEMAEYLIGMPNLAPETCLEVAEVLGLSLPAYRSCVADPAIDERLDADLAWVKDACPDGLPVIWIQDQRFQGVQSPDALAAALRRARQRLEAAPRE